MSNISIIKNIISNGKNGIIQSLRYLWLQLDSQNLFNSSSRGSLIFDQELPLRHRRGPGRGSNPGPRCSWPPISNNPSAARHVRPPLSPTWLTGTMMRVGSASARFLPAAAEAVGDRLAPSLWSHQQPNGGGADRRESTCSEVAQWYPRLAVYDDVRGWNTEQYLGQGEFSPGSTGASTSA